MERTVLPGGLRVVSEHVPGVRSASIGLWVGVGSRDEQPSVAGAAHYLEHLLFKGTPTRSAREIAEASDAVGGELNAFTAKEHTCFYAHVVDEDTPLAVDLVTDVALRGVCAAADVEVERDVVLEEIAMRDDDPEDLAGEAFGEAVFGDHPLGRPIIGSPVSVEAMTRTQLHSFHRRRYTTDRIVVAAAGNVSHAEVVGLVRECLGPRAAGEPDRLPRPGRRGQARLRGRPGLVLTERDGEQAHVVLGVRSLPRHDPRRWALSVLNAAVGGGVSSRLFQQVREERGLAYSVYSAIDTYSDTGTFSVYAGCQPQNLAEVVDLCLDVLAEVARDGITAAELDRAKGQLRGGLVLGSEDTGARMSRLGRGELNHGQHLALDTSLARVAAVTPEQVSAVAAAVLRAPLGASVVGPYARPEELPERLRELARR